MVHLRLVKGLFRVDVGSISDFFRVRLRSI